MWGENPAPGRQAVGVSAASSAVDARPFQGLCMGDLGSFRPGLSRIFQAILNYYFDPTQSMGSSPFRFDGRYNHHPAGA